MNILAVETSTDVCAAALVRDGAVIRESVLHGQRVHSEKLIALIDEVLQGPHEYGAIAVSVGPGSFTGLRIGLSVAKGLAFASGKPLIAVPTLEALALRAVLDGMAGDGDEIIAMIYARRCDVYAAAYQVSGQELIAGWDVEALSFPVLAQRVSGVKRTVCIGDGVEKFRQHCAPKENNWYFPPNERQQCSAAAVGLAGVRMARRGEFADVASLEPMYVKDFSSLVRTQHLS